MADVYRNKVIALAAGLENDEERATARQALRGFIDRIVIPPEGLLQVVGNLGVMLAAAQGRSPSAEDACGISGCGGSQPPVPHAIYIAAA